jgi:predicted AlkP superfamily pyrophosphatase or phosphodiesterase
VQLIDGLVGELVEFFQQRSVQVVLLSEYGITPVDTPVHLNRLFRQEGWLAIKEELGRELLDYGASRVFAVADHQVAHIYCKDVALVPEVVALLQKQAGVSEVLDKEAKRARGLDHGRSGDLIAVAQERSWFTYYYWLEPARAPDFARTVDIHRKPGYDPVELFLDPAIPAVKAKIAWRLLQKKLGFRVLMDIIPLEATLVRGSHGRRPTDQKDWPLLFTSRRELVDSPIIRATDVFGLLQMHIVS